MYENNKNNKIKILKNYLILCEGIDTYKFIINYLNSDALKYDRRFSNDIQALDFGGIMDLHAYINILKNMENFGNVNRILILRDAETDAKSAIQMVQGNLRNAGLQVPSDCNIWVKSDDNLKIAFTLMPACSSEPTSGALEDLCWYILKDNLEMKDDVKLFVEQIKMSYDSLGSHEHKSKLHTFLSVNKEFISLKIGEAASAGAFDWDSRYLVSLKGIIEKGFE